MMQRTILFSLAVLLLPVVSSQAVEGGTPPNERARKVLADREKVTREGFWIYNDLPEAFEQAKQTGKPIVCILRCLPCTECVKLDDDLVDRDPVIRPLLEQFVCVRVVATNGLDLSLFQFDTDQSFAVFFLRDDKTIYGRFGTRSHRTEWIGDVSLPGFAAALEGALSIHRSWPAEAEALKAKRGPEPKISRPENLPSLAAEGRYGPKLRYEADVVQSCIHCHQIGDAIRQDLRDRGQPLPELLLTPYPHPKSLGLILDPKTRGRLSEVQPESIAHQSGFQAGDEIVRMQGQPILSIADIQWVLHQSPATATNVGVEVKRNGTLQAITLALPDGWRERDDSSWRVSSWGMARMATGGMRLEPLDDAARNELSIPSTSMALRVKSVGQYGAHAAAKNAGFKVDDVVTEYDGQSTLMTEAALFRHGVNTRKPGDKVQVIVQRDRKQLTIALPIQP
jgi:serine protease Do